MHRISSDKEYYESGKVAIDADGVPVDLGYRGTGSPEGKVAAPIGAIYVDVSNTEGDVLWVKTSDTGTGGWTLVDLSPAVDLTEVNQALAEMRAIRDEVTAAKLTAFNGSLTKSGDGAAFNTGDIYMNVLTGEIYEK